MTLYLHPNLHLTLFTENLPNLLTFFVKKAGFEHFYRLWFPNTDNDKESSITRKMSKTLTIMMMMMMMMMMVMVMMMVMMIKGDDKHYTALL